MDTETDRILRSDPESAGGRNRFDRRRPADVGGRLPGFAETGSETQIPYPKHFLWFHFLPRPHIVHALEWPEVIPGVGVAMLPPAELETVRKELEEAHKLECHRPDGWNALAYLLAESAVVRGSNRIMSEASEADSRIRLAQELLTETADGMDRIAARCGLSRAALYAKFRQETGVSPRQYRECAILRRAARLLECSGLSVAEIADQVGMPDPYYFSTRFRKFSGVSPREYRRRKQ